MSEKDKEVIKNEKASDIKIETEVSIDVPGKEENKYHINIKNQDISNALTKKPFKEECRLDNQTEDTSNKEVVKEQITISNYNMLNNPDQEIKIYKEAKTEEINNQSIDEQSLNSENVVHSIQQPINRNDEDGEAKTEEFVIGLNLAEQQTISNNKINNFNNPIKRYEELNADDIDEQPLISNVIGNSSQPQTKEAKTEEVGEEQITSSDNRITVMNNPQLLPKNQRPLPADSKTYMLETFKKNIMIIFNHEFVDGYDQRIGTDKDEEALRMTFIKFGFEVASHKDKTRRQVGDLFVDFASQDFTHYGCVAIAILTHGSEFGGLRAKDKKYREKQILDHLKKNPSIVTKPVISIIQACRGDRRQEYNLINVKPSKDSVQSASQYKLPLDADTLVLHSTYDGKYAYRCPNTGSWFIQTLCETIDALADTEDIESILTTVKREVAINREYKKIMKSNEYEYNKQMPVSKSTLIRKLYFVRKEILDTVEEPVVFDVQPVVRFSNEPCQVCVQFGVERFSYIVDCLERYREDHGDDSKAKSLLTIARSCFNGDSDSQIEMSKMIRDFLKGKNERFKFIYFWNDYEN